MLKGFWTPRCSLSNSDVGHEDACRPSLMTLQGIPFVFRLRNPCIFVILIRLYVIIHFSYPSIQIQGLPFNVRWR